MTLPSLRIVILGLSITSSWGNGHATTYRGLVKELSRRGHDVLFLERDAPWYAANRDLPHPPYGRTALYSSLDDLKGRFSKDVSEAHLVMAGSYVPEGAKIGEWLLSECNGASAFYDIDTPVTVSMLERGEEEYVSRRLIPLYDLYLSFSGGPILKYIEERYGAQRARPLYCSVDPDLYYPYGAEKTRDLGYLGTYSADRQGALEGLLVKPAILSPGLKAAVAGSLYPEGLSWPPNVERIEHVPPNGHMAFYNSMRFALNITRADMLRAGWSPSVRLFEAALCATPVITDLWDGMEEFFTPGKDILPASTASEVFRYLEMSQSEAQAVGLAARERVLSAHTPAHRVDALEGYLKEALEREKI